MSDKTERPRTLAFVLRGGGKKDVRWGIASLVEALEEYDDRVEERDTAIDLLRQALRAGGFTHDLAVEASLFIDRFKESER